MPRQLPPLATEFGREVSRAQDLVQRLELARIALARDARSRHLLHVSKLELFYEFAFLRVFLTWEAFLEQTFLRYLCGYHHSGGQEATHSTHYYRTLADAERAVLGQHRYVLWHNPDIVVVRAQNFFQKWQA